MKKTTFFCMFSGTQTLEIVPLGGGVYSVEIWVDRADDYEDLSIKVTLDQEAYLKFMSGQTVLNLFKSFPEQLFVVQTSKGVIRDFFMAYEIDEHPLFQEAAWDVYNIEKIKEYTYRVDTDI